MREFAEIWEIASQRKGGDAALEAVLSHPSAPAELAERPLSDWLEAMAKAIFQAGFNWKVIDAKWHGFQSAFDRFDVPAVACYDDPDLDRLLADKSIVRNGAKLQAVINNAQFLDELDAETGDAARHLAEWPAREFSDLLALFAGRGSRLGGITGARVCRMMGKDSYVLSPAVVKRLAIEGIVDGNPTSKKALKAVQDAFIGWMDESGRPLVQISQTLAMSVD